MDQELNFVFSLLAAVVVAVGIYLAATYKRRRLTVRFHALCNHVWQVQASLRTREWESDHPTKSQVSNAGAVGFRLMKELIALAEECQQHRDIAEAWLLIGRIGYSTVESRCDQALASVAKFNRKLRDYDAKTTN